MLLSLASVPGLIIPALALTFVGLMQGAGVEPYVLTQMERTGILRTIGRENVFPMSEGVGEALLQAVEAAEAWVAAQHELTSKMTPA